MLMSAERNGVSCFGAIVDDPIKAECCVQLRVVVEGFGGGLDSVPGSLATTSESPTWKALLLWFAKLRSEVEPCVAAPGSGHSCRLFPAAASRSHFADAHCQQLALPGAESVSWRPLNTLAIP